MSEPMGAPNVTCQGCSIAPTKEAVETAIRESSTLVEALESVAAMYQIPAENIIVDDRVNSIRVTGDTILTPDRKNPSANTQAIVCAIGAVLDNISQRIDQKLSTYQNTQVAQNKLTASQKTPDPSKGEVVGRYYASDGSEIIAYSSGLVDMDNTPAANAKVNELRASKQIPDFASDAKKMTSRSSYFTAEDDIMNGVKTNDDIKMDIDKQVHDISSRINESAYFIDLMDKFYGTTTLGYDLLQSQGFDYVDKTHAMIQEADAPKGPSSADLRYMRFDNKKIMKAVELLNAMRLELAMNTTPQPKDIYQHPKFKQAVKCLDEQFDCKIIIRSFNVKDDKGRTLTDGSTVVMNDLPQKISISKAKGFQLHGTPIEINVAGDIFKWNPASQDKMFGQSVVSIFLHEIWHNISASLEKESGEFVFTASTAIMLASATDNIKNRRVIIQNCVNTLSEMGGRKINRGTKRRLTRQMLAVVSMKHSEKEVEKLGEVAAQTGNMEDLDKYLAAMEKFIKENDPNKKKKKPGRFKKFLGTSMFVAGAIMIFVKVLAPLGLLLCLTGGSIGLYGMDESMFDKDHREEIQKWMMNANKEEYYADLFASMYKLPPVFGLGPNSKYTPNSINKERLDKLIKLDREIGRIVMDPHPSDEERGYAAVTIAKKMLESGDKLDPAVKKYNEWIVANYSSLKDSEIKDTSSNIFDPKEAEDLDKHLQSIVDGNNITVTESAVFRQGNWTITVEDILNEPNVRGKIKNDSDRKTMQKVADKVLDDYIRTAFGLESRNYLIKTLAKDTIKQFETEKNQFGL